MLIGEQLRRRHQRDLLAGRERGGRGERRDQGLAAADVPLDEPQHRLRQLEVGFDFRERPALRPGQPKRQRREQLLLQLAAAGERPARIALHAPPQQLQRQLVREQFLEREPALRRVATLEQGLDRRVRGRPVHDAQGLAERGQMLVREHGRRQPIGQFGGVRLLERQTYELAQPALRDAFGRRIHRRQVILRMRGGALVDAPVFRVHELEARRRAADLAEAAQPHAARERLALLRAEMKEPQRQEAGAVGDPREELAPAAEHDFGQLDLALDRGALACAQFAERHRARAVLVAQRQEKQQVLDRLDAERTEPLRERGAHAAQRGDRPRGGHSETMHSTSTWAPRGNDATPTVARAGYGSRKYSAMTLLTSAKCARSVR